MKVGLLGDIHGNICALDAVLSSAKRNGVDRLLVTGDLVGYYFYPAEVLGALKKWDCVIVKGNHEDMLIQVHENKTFPPSLEKKYGSGLQIALESFSNNEFDFIKKMPTCLALDLMGRKIILCHGAPWNPEAYIYPDSDQEVINRCASYQADFIIVGHTHRPMDLKARNTRIINPGSVGQPRDKRKGAAWAILDTESGEVLFQREPYDSSALVKECRNRHPEIPYLADVLLR